MRWLDTVQGKFPYGGKQKNVLSHLDQGDTVASFIYIVLFLENIFQCCSNFWDLNWLCLQFVSVTMKW